MDSLEEVAGKTCCTGFSFTRACPRHARGQQGDLSLQSSFGHFGIHHAAALQQVAPGQAASGSQLLRDLASKKVTLRRSLGYTMFDST